VTGRHRPRAGGENDLCAHQTERATDHLPLRKPISADHESHGAERRLRDAQAIARGIEIMGNIEFVDFPMMEHDFTLRIDQHGRVETSLPFTLHESGTNVNRMALRGGAKTNARFTFGYFIGFRSS
jgi:hypothetical protein